MAQKPSDNHNGNTVVIPGGTQHEYYIRGVDVCVFNENGIEKVAVFVFGSYSSQYSTPSLHSLAPSVGTIKSSRWTELGINIPKLKAAQNTSGASALFKAMIPPPCITLSNDIGIIGITVYSESSTFSLSRKQFLPELVVDIYAPSDTQTIGLGSTPTLAYMDALRKLNIDAATIGLAPRVRGLYCERQDRDSVQYYIWVVKESF